MNSAQGTGPEQLEPLPAWFRRGSVLVVMFAVFAPVTIPVLLVGLPVLGFIFVMRMKKRAEEDEARAAALGGGGGGMKQEEEQNNRDLVAEKQKTETVVVQNKTTKPSPKQETSTNSIATETTTKPAAGVGGAAILAKLRAARNYIPPKDHPVVVLYGSQTGTAAEVAKNISAGIEGMGVSSRVMSMNEMGFGNVSKDKTPFVILVCSSTGDGEAPDNATKFYMDVRRKSHPEGMLHGIQFTSLGLGDSNYTRYMHVPRVLKTRFIELGAKEFHPSAEADEVDGLEDVIDAWIEKMLPVVKVAVKPEEKQGGAAPRNASSTIPPLPSCSIQLYWIDGVEKSEILEKESQQGMVLGGEDKALTEYTAAEPYYATISSARYLTTEQCDPDRRVIHMQFDLGASGITYAPGDSLGVLPENDPALVDSLIDHLGLDKDACFSVKHKNIDSESTPDTRALQHIRWPCSIRFAFLHGVDLTTPPKKSLLRVLAEYCTDPSEKKQLLHLCSRDGRQDYMNTIVKAHKAFCDILVENTSCKPPLDALLDALPPLAPRMYSISSSPDVTGDTKAEVAFTAVEYEVAGGPKTRKGVATWWLESMAQPLLLNDTHRDETSTVPLFLRKGGAFSTPKKLDVPWILIGPGTGVAPFRGFLQQRRRMLSTTTKTTSHAEPCWLFFGCREVTKDFLYGEELQSFEKDGTLTKLLVAESRKKTHTEEEGKNKVYVQHLMAQHAQELHDMIVNKNAYIFICGDGHGMAKDVHNTLIDIIAASGDRAHAEHVLTTKTQDATYVKDVWS